MSHEHDRDTAIERLLRGNVGSDVEPRSTEQCLDPETVAALMDGELAPAARQAAETHASRCARCQSMLAVMVQSGADLAASLAPAGILPGFRRSLRWLVPLTGGALAATVWLMVGPQMRTPSPAPSSVSLQRPAEPPPAAAADRSALAAEEAVAPQLKDESPRVDSPPSTPVPAEPQRLARDARRAPGKPEADTASVDAIGSRAKEAELAVAGKAAAPVEPVPPLPEVRPAPVATLPSAPPPAASMPARSRQPAVRAGRAESAATEAAEARTLAFRTAAEPVVIVSPDAASRWRITPTDVEHSTDGGATWTVQTLPQGVVPVAGSAPSRNICWIVGRAGLVLLTTDGATWQRVPFPEAIDLAAVRATDERTATVQSADGRSFHTSDRGIRWRQ